MIYTELTKKAMKLMFKAHEKQKDRSGIPYVFHPWHVAESMEDEITCCAALLHYTVEDTELTFDDLRQEGFPEEVIRILQLLTHDPAEDYYDYVKRIAEDPLARKVKLSDLYHNSDLSRLNKVSEKDIERREKYLRCIRYLEEIEASGS